MHVRQLGCRRAWLQRLGKQRCRDYRLLTGAGDLGAKGCLSVRADEQTLLRGGQSMIFMVPKFTGAAYFAATEKGAKEAVAELKGRGVSIDFSTRDRASRIPT